MSSIEGVDQLARIRGPELFAEVEAMTHEAMDGKIAVESVFGQRLDIIRPSTSDVDLIGQKYIETIEPTIAETLSALGKRGWTPIILSGGFRPCIMPLANLLKISRVEAVDLYFDENGEYVDFDRDYPTTRSGGKPEVIERLRADFQPEQIVMVGDGVSDLETRDVVSKFIGFGGYVRREKVATEAETFITRLDELLGILP